MHKQYSRKLGKIGRPKTPSYYVTLPLDEVKALGWEDGQELVVRRAEHARHLIIEAVWYEDGREGPKRSPDQVGGRS